MVNTGLPSPACETCRQRRVKCDLRRPTCARCEGIGRECHYRDLNNPDVVFRIRTPASYTRQRRRKKQPERGQESAAAWSSSASSAASSPSPGLTERWEIHIMPLIMHQLSFPSRNGGREYGSLECFSGPLQRAEPGSIVYLACNAVGNIYRMNMNHAPSREMVLAHRTAYGQSLQRLRVALDRSVEERPDDVLLSVWLLCLYELMLGTASGANQPASGPVNWAIHSRALMGILRSRGEAQFRTKTGCQLFQVAYHYIQVQVLQLGTEPDPEAKTWFQTIKSQVDPKDPIFVFLPSFYLGDEVARLCSRAPISFHQAFSTAEKLAVIEHTFQACQNLELSMTTSFEQLVNRFPSKRMARSSEKVEHSYLVLHIRNHFDTCIIRMYSVISELLTHGLLLADLPASIMHGLTQRQLVCIEGMENYASRILLTVPRFLSDKGTSVPGWPDALRLLWPLRVILHSTNQSAAAQGLLKRLAHEVGIMQAVGSFFGSDPQSDMMEGPLLPSPGMD